MADGDTSNQALPDPSGVSDTQKYRGYEEYPWEGHSSNYGPLENKLGEGYGVGLGKELQEKYHAPVGSWVNVPPYGWRQVNETSAKDQGIEFYTSHIGSVPDQLSIEGVSHHAPPGMSDAPGMDGKLHMTTGHELQPPYKPNYREGDLYGEEQAEAEVKADEALHYYEELEKQQKQGTDRESIQKPDDSVLSPDNVVKRIRQQYPGSYDNVADQKLYQAFREKHPTGLEQMRSMYPQYAGVSDDKFLKAVKSRYYPKDSEDEFKDRMQPTDVIHNVMEQVPNIIPSFYENLAELAKSPERFAQEMLPILQKLGIQPKTDQQGMVQPMGLVGSAAAPLYQWAQREAVRGQKWEKDHKIPAPHELAGMIAMKAARGIGAAPQIIPAFLPIGGELSIGKLVIPHVAGLVLGMMYDGVQAEGRAREAGMDRHLMMGAEAMGSRALAQWLLYTPRGRILSGIMWAVSGMSDEAAKNWIAGTHSTLNDYISTGVVNGLFGGIFSLGPEKIPADAQSALTQAMQARASGNYAQAAQLLDRTMLLLPDVEKRAATNNLLAWRNQAIEARPGALPLEQPNERGFLTIRKKTNVYQDVMQKFSGEPEPEGADIRTQGPSVIYARAPQKLALPAPRPAEEPTIPTIPSGETIYARSGRRQEALEFGDAPFSPRDVPSSVTAEPPSTTQVAEPVGQKPYESGPESLETSLKDAYQSLQKRQLGNAVFISDLARESGLSVEEMHNWMRQNVGRYSLDDGHLPSATPEQKAGIYDDPLYQGTPINSKKLLIRLPEADVPRETQSPADHMTDQFYYSGIDLRVVTDELDKIAKAIGKTPVGRFLQASAKYGEEVRDVFTPEHVTKERESAAALIGQEIGKAQRDSQRMAQVFWKRQELEDQIRFAYETDQRSAFWLSRKQPELMTWFERHEAGLSTGNPVADLMFKKHDDLMSWVNKQEEAQGFRHGLRESYIYHALERPEDAQKLGEDIKRNGWGNPDFMRPRELPTMETVHALGYRLKTYNLEALDQMRIDAFLRNRMRANMLDQFRDAGLAYTQADFDAMQANALSEIRARGEEPPANFKKRMDAFIAELKNQAELWTSPRKTAEGDRQQSYWVHGSKKEGASLMLHRSTDPVDWGIAAPIIAGAQGIKQRTTGLVLGWSGYHHLHMLPISAADAVTSALRKTIQGTANLNDWSLAVQDSLSFGLGSHLRSLNSNQKLLNWYIEPGRTVLKDLSPHDQKMFELQQAGGFVPQISHERQIQLARMILKGKAGSVADTALNIGYGLASSRPYQRWLFGRAIPSMKMYSFNRAAEALLEKHPEFNRPFYKLQRDVELRKIARQVDARYGEQNLRQAFEHPRIKVLGQTLFLSYSWLKSFIDVYGGGIHDLTKVPKHMAEIMRSTEARDRYLTDKLVYMLTLTGITTMANAVIATALGVGVQSLTDLIYPNSGVGPDGKLKRIKPPFWVTTELGGLHHDIVKMGGYNISGVPLGFQLFFFNKLQPALSTIGDLLHNRDYFGNIIVRPADPGKGMIDNLINQLKDVGEFVIKNEMPFSLQQGMQPGATLRDNLLGMAGLSRAPKYAERSDVENDIVDTWVRSHAGEKDKEAQEQIDANHEFRQALLAHDDRAAQIAREDLKRLGVSDRSINKTSENAGKSEAERLFPDLTASQQRLILKKAFGQPEFQTFIKLAHPQVKAEFGGQ